MRKFKTEFSFEAKEVLGKQVAIGLSLHARFDRDKWINLRNRIEFLIFSSLHLTISFNIEGLVYNVTIGFGLKKVVICYKVTIRKAMSCVDVELSIKYYGQSGML